MAIIKREAILKVATNETMWDRRNVKLNNNSHAVLDKPYKITPGMDKNGGQTRAFTIPEERHYMPSIIGIESNAPDFSKRCMQYWQSILKVFDANGLTLDISFEVEEDKIKKFQEAPENEKYKYGQPISLIDYVYFRYCLNWAAVANSYNIYQAKKHAKGIKYYFYTEDEVKQAQQAEVNFTQKVMKSYIKAVEDDLATEAVLRYFERGKTSHDTAENIGEVYIYDELDPSDIQRLLLKIQKACPGRFVQIVEDPKIKNKVFIHRCISANVLRMPKGSTMIYQGDNPVGSTLEDAINNIQANAELKNELVTKLEAIKAQS